jgi:hypothetical protein
VPEALAAVTALSVVSFFLDPFVGNRLSATFSLSLSFGGITVAGCLPPKVRFLDGVVCVLLSRGALSVQVACRAP